MKLSWLFVLFLILLVAIFSVQNAAPIPVRFLGWNITISTALVILLSALCGGLIGLLVAMYARRGAVAPPRSGVDPNSAPPFRDTSESP